MILNCFYVYYSLELLDTIILHHTSFSAAFVSSHTITLKIMVSSGSVRTFWSKSPEKDVTGVDVHSQELDLLSFWAWLTASVRSDLLLCRQYYLVGGEGY